VILAVSALPAPAQQFSADLVRKDAAGTASRPAGKLNVLNGKVRIEIPDAPGGFFLVLGDADAAYFVRPAQKIFMDARQSSQLTQVLVAVDPDDPCARWQAMAKIAGAASEGTGWRCERIGDDTIDDRRAIGYRATSPRNQRYVAWIDSRLHFAVRLRSEDDAQDGAGGGTGDGAVLDLVNIREAPQPEELFAVPAGYRKFDPQQLINIIKQSDVWVEPPR
jgi:hypothetical protein